MLSTYLKHVKRDRHAEVIIARNLPGAGRLSRDELQAFSQKSVGILQELGPGIQWIQSYVTDDKVYCVYYAPSEALIKEHARCGGFPANRIAQVRDVIDPTTAGPERIGTRGRRPGACCVIAALV